MCVCVCVYVCVCVHILTHSLGIAAWLTALSWIAWREIRSDTLTNCRECTYRQGWPELHKYTVHDHIFGDFPAKINKYKPYKHGSGQPCI